jgi:hypothetical protein
VSLSAVVSPAPDGGSVTFSDAGAPISGCTGLTVNSGAGGQVKCRTSFAQPGVHRLTASYSGDSLYAASTSAALNETVTTGAGPTLTSLRVVPRRVSLAGRRIRGRCVKATAQNRHHPRCRTSLRVRISYTLSGAGTVTLTFTRVLAGRRTGRRCVKPTPHNRTHTRCTRLHAVPGRTVLSGQAGTNVLVFTGIVARRRLAPGRYRMSAAASAGRPRSATFTIVG